MPGQRFARLKVKCTNVGLGASVQLWLNGSYQQFPIQLPGFILVGAAVARQLAAAIPVRLAYLGQSATYTVAYEPGADDGEGFVVVTATGFESSQNFRPSTGTTGFADVERLDGIKPVLVEPTVTVVNCFGSSTGAIALHAYNGTRDPTGPYTYLWDDGVTTPGRANLPAGSYTVTVTDVTGAYAVATIGVGQHPALTVVLNRTGNDLTPSVAGGVGPYTYLWSDGVTSALRTNVLGGVTYTLTVTDANGCSKTASLRFELLRYWFSGNAIPLTSTPAMPTGPTPPPSPACASPARCSSSPPT